MRNFEIYNLFVVGILVMVCECIIIGTACMPATLHKMLLKIC